MRADHAIKECCICFVNHLDEEMLRNFWWNFLRVVRSSINDWIDVLAEFVGRCAVTWLAFMEFLPDFVVRYDDEAVGRFLGVMAKRIGIAVGAVGTAVLALEIIRAPVFRGNVPGTLEAFVRMMNAGVCGSQCAVLIEGMCDRVSEENCTAIQALIRQIPGQRGDEQNRAIVSLLSMLE
jgi:hypothetical protein